MADNDDEVIPNIIHNIISLVKYFVRHNITSTASRGFSVKLFAANFKDFDLIL